MRSLQTLQGGGGISIIDNARIKDNRSRYLVTVQQLFDFDRSVMAYKIMNKLCPENLQANFYKDRTILSTILGLIKIFKSQNIILNILRKALLRVALKIWNKIPIKIREFPTLLQHKKQLRVYLLRLKIISTRHLGRPAVVVFK